MEYLFARLRSSLMVVMSVVAILWFCPLARAQFSAEDFDAYRGLKRLPREATGFFRLSKVDGAHCLVTPGGHAYVALGVNHISALMQRDLQRGSQSAASNVDWERYWNEVLESRVRDWNVTCLGYDCPPTLHHRLPWFATINIAPIEKHRSDPPSEKSSAYRFPDVFDPEWEQEVTNRIENAARPLRDDRFLVGYFWTDTPTWDLLLTRALRGTDWVSEIRKLSPSSPGRQRYAAFLQDRYVDHLTDLNTIYGLSLESLDQLKAVDLSSVAVGRHVVQEEDEIFLGLIAKQFFDVVGKAQRAADPNHLVFGDRFLAGDSPESVLKAASPWIDAVAVQPGDRYTRLYPASTQFPEPELELMHRTTGKPVLICDHAISFPTRDQPRTIFEQMPDETAAAQAAAEFLRLAFQKPYLVGYLRCQYIDRPANFGRGLRQGLVDAEGKPREAIVSVYREGFARVLSDLR